MQEVIAEAPIVESKDKLAKFREQVAAERPRGMSEAAKLKLRGFNEHETRNEEAGKKLVEEFNGRTWTVEQLMDLFAKSFGGDNRVRYETPHGSRSVKVDDLPDRSHGSAFRKLCGRSNWR